MSVVATLLLAAAVVVYVSYPLFRRRGGAQAVAVALSPDAFVVDGVAYESEEEWALERALGRAGEGAEGVYAFRARADLDAGIEQQVAALRLERREARAGGRRLVCEGCGKPFRSGDNYCARCGQPHPSICLRCGERVRPGDRFCTRCGAAVAGGQAG
ncbi:MAG: zinc ribbon domain-containing protein [Anaerolineae bacterium]|nr:zinc ribbon domain-containing protein [Anaerolineae bacterium]